MDWQETLANAIAKAGNAAVDVYVYKETGQKTNGTGSIWVPNAQQPTTPLQVGQAQTGAMLTRLQNSAPMLIIGGLALVVLWRVMRKG